MPAALYAEAKYATCVTPENDPEYTLWRKAGRGLSNILFSPLELFYQPVYMAEKGNRLPIAVLGGLVKGIAMMGIRIAAGAYETATFPFPMPLNYKPVVYPEFVTPDYCTQREISGSL